MLDTGGMQSEIEPVPTIEIDHLAFAIDIFQDNIALPPPLMQDNSYLLQLTDNIGVPVTGHRLVCQHVFSHQFVIQKIHPHFDSPQLRQVRQPSICIAALVLHLMHN